MFRRSIAIAVSCLAVTASVSACSSSKAKTSPSSPPTSHSSTTGPTGGASSTSTAASTLLGPGCATLGLSAAALAPAAAAPVGTVAANVPFLSNVVTAAKAGGLTATLNSAPALAVFAPVDAAFKKEPAAQVQALLTDPKMKAVLVATLKYHVLAGKVAKDALVGRHKTLQGSDISIAGSGDSYTVNGKAKILCGGIQTKNATVYLIDTVLHPAGRRPHRRSDAAYRAREWFCRPRTNRPIVSSSAASAPPPSIRSAGEAMTARPVSAPVGAPWAGAPLLAAGGPAAPVADEPVPRSRPAAALRARSNDRTSTWRTMWSSASRPHRNRAGSTSPCCRWWRWCPRGPARYR
ncbi:MAG: fasciclin domain-containing protein [Jatrophihabitantaceae bacterium]